MGHKSLNMTIHLGVLLLAVGACSGPPEPSGPDVVALWDRGEITRAQLDGFILEQPPGRRLPPENLDRVEWMADQAERLFQRRVVVSEERLAELSQNDVFENQLHVPIVKGQARAFLADYDKRQVVTRQEAEEYYQEHKADFLRPERRAFRSLYLATPAGGSPEEIKVKVEDLRRQALGGASFEALVVAHSDSSNAEFGGLVGPIERSDLRGIVGQTVFGLEVGEVSEVVASSGGFLLFKLASLEPASEDNFEIHFPAIAEVISNQRRRIWRNTLVENQAGLLGVDLPEFDDADLSTVADTETVLFEINEIKITAADVFADGSPGGPAGSARQLSEDAVFAAALRLERPQDAAAIADRILRNRAHDQLLREALFAEVESWPEDDFRAFFEANASRFTTSAQVELTVFSWPLSGDDPVEEIRAPEAFAEALGRGEGRDAWAVEVVKSGVRKENVRLTDLRTLASRAPWIASRLTGEVEEGQVVGPFRSGSRLWVLTIDTFVPSRQLVYEEARTQIPANLLAIQWREVFVRWGEHLAAERGFVVFEDRLEAFGTDLIALEKDGNPEAGD